MTIRLNWEDNNLAEDGHRVYRGTTPLDPEDLPLPLAELGPDVTTWDDTDVEPSTTYFYRVTAVMGDVEAVSDETQVTTAGVLQPPTNVVVTLEDAKTHPTVIGEAFGGGYYIGNIVVADGGADDGEYAVIMGGPESQPGTLQWKTSSTETGGADSLTNGKANTLAMEAAGLESHPAALYCVGYTGGAHDDWYLPATQELDLAWVNRAELAVLVMDEPWYWSSLENQATTAWAQSFVNGAQNGNRNKVASYGVRPVRRILIPQE